MLLGRPEDKEKTIAAEINPCFLNNAGCVFDTLVKKLKETILCITDEQRGRKIRSKDTSAKGGQLFEYQTKQLIDK